MKNRIEAIRKERGIRQEEFAKSLGVSRQTISSLENGRYNPSILQRADGLPGYAQDSGEFLLTDPPLLADGLDSVFHRVPPWM